LPRANHLPNAEPRLAEDVSLHMNETTKIQNILKIRVLCGFFVTRHSPPQPTKVEIPIQVTLTVSLTELCQSKMGASDGRGERSVSGDKATSSQHRYFTRSSREQSRSHYPDHERVSPPLTQTPTKPINMSSRPRPIVSDGGVYPDNEIDAHDSETAAQLDSMMDQIAYSTSNPVRAPFPSPAMKSTQPFYPFPSQQSNHLLHPESGWTTQQEQSWHGGSGGSCILVEAANRAQMAILVDDMSSMAIEQMEQS
jgi:hypothetical protein